MALSDEELKLIKEGFHKEYLDAEPFNRYVNGVTLEHTIRTVQDKWNVRDRDVILRPDESLNDSCILANLEYLPPQDVELPQEYHGLRVFYRVVGKNVLREEA